LYLKRRETINDDLAFEKPSLGMMSISFGNVPCIKGWEIQLRYEPVVQRKMEFGKHDLARDCNMPLSHERN
jgi:hypothetical protein